MRDFRSALGVEYRSEHIGDMRKRNDAVLIGCPGTDLAPNAAGFHLDGGHVYVGDASTDPVGMLGELNGLSHYVNRDNIGGQVLGLAPGLGADPAADGSYPAFVRTADEIELRVGLLIAQMTSETAKDRKERKRS